MAMDVPGSAERGEGGTSAKAQQPGHGGDSGPEELGWGDASWGGGDVSGAEGGGWDSEWPGCGEDQDGDVSGKGPASRKGAGRGARYDASLDAAAQCPKEGHTVLDIEIPYNLRDCVMGPNGARIHGMELQTGARIAMDDKHPGRAIVRISGGRDAVRSARTALGECLEEGKGKGQGRAKGQGWDCHLQWSQVSAPAESSEAVEVLELPPGSSGSVVGVKGSRIRELMYLSGAFIQVERQGEHDSALISGTKKAVAYAKKLINDTLDALSLLHESSEGSGRVSKMDAIKNPSGRPISELTIGEEVKGIVTAVVPTLGVWFDIGAVKWGMLLWRDLLGNTFWPGEVVEDLRIKSLDSRADRFYVLPPWGRVVGGERIEIPHGFTGLVLGEGGSRIMEISKQSGASLSVDQTLEQHYVCIGGEDQAVAMAKALVSTLLEGAMAAASLDRSGASKGKGKLPQYYVKETRSWSVPTDYVRLPPAAIPALIGKGGTNITAIAAKTGARISIQQRTGEEVAMLYGPPDNVAAAKAAVIQETGDFLREQAAMEGGKGEARGKGKVKGKRALTPRRSYSDVPGECEERRLMETMDLPAGATPLIVGIRGVRILELQTQTGASVYIDDSSEPHQACIKGTPEAIAAARAKLQELLDNSTMTIFEGKVIRLWKAGKGKGRGKRGAIESPPDVSVEIPEWALSRFIGKHGARIQDLMFRSGAYITVKSRAIPAIAEVFGTPEAVEKAKPLISEVVEQIRESDERFKSGKGHGRGDELSGPEDGGHDSIGLLPSEYDPLEMTQDDIPRVIGKAGMNIKDIQARSGAQVIIDANSDPPLAWFSGSAEDVASAKVLMVELLNNKHEVEGPRDSRGSARRGRGRGMGRDASRLGEDAPARGTAGRARRAHSPSRRSEATMHLPHEAAQRVLGGGSALIRRIQVRSGAAVHVKQVQGRYQASISGTQKAISDAKALLSTNIAQVEEGGPETRTELFQSVFTECDADSDGRLALPEMRRFAKFAGWLEVGNGDWARDYEDLCGDVGVDPVCGIDCDSLEALVSDDSGRHLSDTKLNSMLDALVTETKRVQRSELVEVVFNALAQDAAGMLSSQALQSFVEQLHWFPRPDGTPWEECYEAFCEDIGADAARGLSLEQFDRFVNNDECDSGGHFTDEQLRSVLDALGKRKDASASGRQGKHGASARSSGLVTPALEVVAADGAQPIADTPELSPSRNELICKVFALCDGDADGRLKAEELGAFAELAPWLDGDSSEWIQEYENLCSDNGIDMYRGLDLKTFTMLVNGKSTASRHYCTEKQLRSVLRHLEVAGQRRPSPPSPPAAPSLSSAPADAQPKRPAVPAPPSRHELLRELFEACDADRDGHLSQRELRRFAELAMWFDGDDEAWAEEYECLCGETRADADVGLRLEPLAQLVDDERGAFCTDRQLRAMLEQLRSQGVVRGEPATSSAVFGEPSPTAEAEVDRQATTEPVSARGGAPAKEGRGPRSELIGATFRACDVDGDGRLKSREMQRFAELALWFEGTEAEWAPEYESLCSDIHAEAEVGFNLDMFEQAVNDESGGFCTDEQLRFVLEDLHRAASSAAPYDAPNSGVGSGGAGDRLSTKQPAATQSMSRKELIGAVFRILDVDGKGLLREKKLRRFGDLTGFTGDDQDWIEAYAMLCAEFGADPNLGIDEPLFDKIVSDVSEETGNCHCTDAELREFLAHLKKTDVRTEASTTSEERQKRPSEGKVRSRRADRDVAIEALFRALDVDCDGRLSMSEMRPFAACTGFQGGDEEWASEFMLFCKDCGRANAGAIELDAFAKLVNDTSEETGCYCSDGEIRDILEMLAARQSKSPRGRATVASAGGADDKLASTAGPAAEAAKKPEEQERRHPEPGGGETVDTDRSQKQGSPPRARLIKAVFEALDSNGDGVLSESEMLRFACCTGFQGSLEEWSSAYRELCMEAGGRGCEAVDFSIFTGLVNDQSEDTGCYCTDAELRQICDALTSDLRGKANPASAVCGAPKAAAGCAAASPPVRAEQRCSESPSVPAQQASTARAGLVERAFRLLDADEDGRIGQQELRRLFEHKGWYCTDSEWVRSYATVCKRNGGGDAVTVDSTIFTAIVDNLSEVSGCYCTDEELRSFQRERPPSDSQTSPVSPAKPEPEIPAASGVETATQLFGQVRLERLNPDPMCLDRPGLVRAVFRLLDADEDGRIDQRALRQLVEHGGCFFSDQDWEASCRRLLARHGSCEGELVDLALFEELVDEDSNEDCSCSDEDLRTILTDMLLASMPTCPGRPVHKPPEAMPVATTVPASGSREASARHEPAANGSAGKSAPPPPPPPPPASARGELISAVFHKLDADGDGRLQELEVRRFAECTGAYYSDSEWKDVYRRICSKCEKAGVVGVDLSLFATLANGESQDIGLFCSDNELRSLLGTDEAVAKHVALPPPEVSKSGVRAGLISAVFKALDLDNDGILKLCEVRRLAEHVGYFCSDEDWARLHRRLCAQLNRAGDSPLDHLLFETLVSDDREGGCYCDDDELEHFLSTLPTPASGSKGLAAVAPAQDVGEESGLAQDSSEVVETVVAEAVPPDPSLQSRRELLHLLFVALDVDGDARLNQEEMRIFAQLTGFEGSDEDWADAYVRLCCENGGDPLAGVDEVVLANLVDDESEEYGCYCSTNELRDILDQLRQNGYARSR